MAEWTFAMLVLTAVVVLLTRRGFGHHLVRGVPWAVIAAFAAAAWMLESLPFTAFPAPPSLLTAIAVGIGVMTGRLASRAMVGWATGMRRDVAEGIAEPRARLMHPLLGAGMVVFAAPLVYGLVALRHESLEIQLTPRDPSTGVVLGAEDRRIAGDPAKSHGVLLLHGFLGSPADLGDLPARLAAEGFTVRALRLPGHGTRPSVLDDVVPSEYEESVDAARGELAAACSKVSVVGFSFGGSLAVRSAAKSPPFSLVLVNPWFGRTATPSWSPVATDSLISFFSKFTPRVVRPTSLTRIEDTTQLTRVRTYATVRTRAAAAARDMAAGAAAPELAAKITSPALLVLSTHDRTAEPGPTESWFASLPAGGAPRRTVRCERSDHVVLLDHDRDAAIAAIVEFLTTGR